MGNIWCICGSIIWGIIGIGGIIDIGGPCWYPTTVGPIGVIAVIGMDCICVAIGGATIGGMPIGGIIIGCWETCINGVPNSPGIMPGIIACGEGIGIGGIICGGIIPAGLIPAGGSKIVRGALPVRQRIKPQLW